MFFSTCFSQAKLLGSFTSSVFYGMRCSLREGATKMTHNRLLRHLNAVAYGRILSIACGSSNNLLF